MAAYMKNGQMHLIRTSSGDSKLPPLVTADSQTQVREDTLSWIKETAERESGYVMKDALIAVPCWCSMERRSVLNTVSKRCGLSVLRIVWDLDMVAQSYCESHYADIKQRELQGLIYYCNDASESVAAFEWGDDVIEMLFEAGKLVKPAGGRSQTIESSLDAYSLKNHPFQYLFFVGKDTANCEVQQQGIIEQLEQIWGKRPEIVQIESDAILQGAFLHTSVIIGGDPILLFPTVPIHVGVRSAAWEEPEWLVPAGSTFPLSQQWTYRLVGAENNGGIYYGKEKLFDLPIEIEPIPGMPAVNEHTKEASARMNELLKEKTGKVEIIIGNDMNCVFSAHIHFLETDLKYDLTSESMEKIRAAALSCLANQPQA